MKADLRMLWKGELSSGIREQEKQRRKAAVTERGVSSPATEDWDQRWQQAASRAMQTHSATASLALGLAFSLLPAFTVWG